MEPEIGSRVLLGKALMLIDTAWGALLVLGVGANDAGGGGLLLAVALAISLVAGLPAYVLDSRSRRRIIIFLPALYLFRWYVEGYSGAPQHLNPPWRGSVLLIVASVLLQWSKLQKIAT